MDIKITKGQGKLDFRREALDISRPHSARSNIFYTVSSFPSIRLKYICFLFPIKPESSSLLSSASYLGDNK